MFKANEIRIYPTEKQRADLTHNFGCVRWVYNWALTHHIEAYNNKKTRPHKFAMSKMLTDLKKQDETAWLKDACAQSLCESIFHLDKVLDDNKLEHGLLKYKRKHDDQSATYPVGVSIIDEDHIKIPKLGVVYSKGVRNFPEDDHYRCNIKVCTVTKTKADEYFISICYTGDKVSEEAIAALDYTDPYYYD